MFQHPENKISHWAEYYLSPLYGICTGKCQVMYPNLDVVSQANRDFLAKLALSDIFNNVFQENMKYFLKEPMHCGRHYDVVWIHSTVDKALKAASLPVEEREKAHREVASYLRAIFLSNSLATQAARESHEKVLVFLSQNAWLIPNRK